MKTRLITLALGLAGSLSAGLYCADAKFEVSAGISIESASDFYQPLAANGAWISVGNFGRCWHPAVTAEWRPYCTGYWEWTDCGWYWVSDESWAWACYHYGTWAEDPQYGWVWIPGTEWAPAWVNWRSSDDYIGWAPCGPSGITIESSYYVFVQSGHFNDHLRPDRVIVNNTSIMNRTTEVRNVGREQREINGRTQTVVVNNGPDMGLVEKATHHKFTPVSVQKADENTFRNAPAPVRKLAKEPRQQPATTLPEVREPQHPPEGNTKNGQLLNHGQVPDATPRGNQEVPHNLQPGQEVPRNYQPGREVPVPPDRSGPVERNYPGTLPERTIPQTPPQHVIPPGNNELPGNHGERQKEIVPPGQVPRQPVPVTPPASIPPAQKGNQAPDHDRDHQGSN